MVIHGDPVFQRGYVQARPHGLRCGSWVRHSSMSTLHIMIVAMESRRKGDGGRDGRRWNEVLLMVLMCLLRFPEKVLVAAWLS